MTYKLPFDLKQKPLAHYFEHGVIRFSCTEGKLWYRVIHIRKDTRGEIQHGLVTSKEQLDKLLKVKSLNEIPSIEVVN